MLFIELNPRSAGYQKLTAMNVTQHTPEANLENKSSNRHRQGDVAAHEPPHVTAEHHVPANKKSVVATPLLMPVFIFIFLGGGKKNRSKQSSRKKNKNNESLSDELSNPTNSWLDVHHTMFCNWSIDTTHKFVLHST